MVQSWYFLTNTVVTIGWLGAVFHMGEILYTSPYLTIFFFWRFTDHTTTDLHARCLKPRGLTQGRAFWGLIDEQF
jgi:hypothetical protein